MRRLMAVACLGMAALTAGCARPLPPEVVASAAGQPYTLASGDRLRIIVFGQDSLSNSYSVDASGNISMPLIGVVHVGDLTTTQAQQAVEARLRNGYLRDPKVSCEVEAYRPFFILGEVTAAGQYPFVSGMTVETAVAIAGGFTPRGSKSDAELTRAMNGQVVSGTVPMYAPVRPGDTIRIRERFF